MADDKEPRNVRCRMGHQQHLKNYHGKNYAPGAEVKVTESEARGWRNIMHRIHTCAHRGCKADVPTDGAKCAEHTKGE